MKLNASPLRLGSLNVEKYKHLDLRVIPALRAADLDVICLQEVPEDKVSHLESSLGASAFFVPTAIRVDPESQTEKAFGLAILMRRGEMQAYDHFIYHSAALEGQPAPADRILQYASVEKDGICYRVGNTHFTWTPDGEASEDQFRDLDLLFGVINKHVPDGDLILCGDFNAPRGKIVWDMLANRYRDNIPQWVFTTLDQTYHRAAPIFYVVDGMFTSRHYAAFDMDVQDGISDHMLITGSITRV